MSSPPERFLEVANTHINESPAVSEISLGDWQVDIKSGRKEMIETEAIAIVQTKVDVGVNVFDTTPNYRLDTGEIPNSKFSKYNARCGIN